MKFEHINNQIQVDPHPDIKGEMTESQLRGFLTDAKNIAALTGCTVRLIANEVPVYISPTSDDDTVEKQFKRVTDYITPEILEETSDSVYVQTGLGWIPTHIKRMIKLSENIGKTVIATMNDVEVHANSSDDYSELCREFDKQMSIQGVTVAKL